MMRRNLSIDELDGLLEEPIIAVIGTYRRDGSVLLSPLWHEWQDGSFVFVSPLDRVKCRHVRRDPRASIVVYEQQRPFRGLEATCTAAIETEHVHETHARIAARYLGPEAGAAAAERKSTGQAIVRLTPVSLRAWDYRGEL
jgi:PPOX class probable F420-dependent enzyme